MPRLTNRLPKICRHANGQAFIKLGGRAFYLGKWGDRKEPSQQAQQEYEQLTAEWLANGRSFTAPIAAVVAGEMTVNQLCVAYLPRAKREYSRGEYDCLRSAIRPLRELYGHTPVREFGPLALKAVREKMIERKHPWTKKNWSREYVNEAVSRIRRIFRWGVENELVPVAVLQALKAVPGLAVGKTKARETEPRYALPVERIDAVKRLVRKQRTRDLIDLMLLTAARPGEILSLTGAMLDCQGEVWVARLKEHKTAHRGKSRSLYFGPQAQLILRRYLKTDPTRRLFPIQLPSFRGTIAKACKRAGIPRWTPHWLRHTALTRLRSEFEADAAQVLAGHSDLRTTERYARPDERKGKAIALKVG